jgi:hypothetical protein
VFCTSNDSGSHFVRIIELRDTTFWPKQQLFIYQKMSSGMAEIFLLKKNIANTACYEWFEQRDEEKSTVLF